ISRSWLPVMAVSTSKVQSEELVTRLQLVSGCWQAVEVPLQTSAVQMFPSEVQEIPCAFTASAGHVALDPVQFSARSHWPAAARQVMLEDWKPSAGHVVLVPSQLSATSQSPAAVRQTVPALPAGCWHSTCVPSH